MVHWFTKKQYFCIKRNLIEFKKSIESQEKVKTEGFDKHL